MRRLYFWQVKKQTMFLGVAAAAMMILFGIWGLEAIEDYELAKAENQPAIPLLWLFVLRLNWTSLNGECYFLPKF